MRAVLSRLARDPSGASLVEFAVIAPVLLTMLLGVVQVGSWIQAYNAVRNVVNDTTRFTMVEYQRGNKINAESIQNRAKAIAGGTRYNLIEDDVAPTVTAKTTQVNGVRQMNLKVDYPAPTFVPVVGLVIPTVTYNRDIYVYDSSAIAGS